MSDLVDVGVDFGTTNCVAGRITEEGGTTVYEPVRSFAVWHNENIKFDEEAYDLSRSRRNEVYPIRDLKLKLQDENSGIRIGADTESIVDISAQLLEFVTRGRQVRRAIIGTPVRMSRSHRIALRQAAKKAGYGEVRLVYEPTAALIGAVDLEALNDPSLTLVVDWGGGTLDIAAVKTEDRVFRELTVDGNINELGGTMIDEELTTRLLQEHPHIREEVSSTEGGFELLKEDVEEEKIEILQDLRGLEAEPRPIVPGWLSMDFRLEPYLVHRVMRDFAERGRKQIVGALEAADIPTHEIDHVLFAGGTCETHIVRNEIASAFPRAQAIEDPNPQLLTGRGCTKLLRHDFQVELAGDLAVRQSDDTLCVLLQRGHPVDLNAYRVAEFEVTDISAPEAVLDIGLCHFIPGTSRMISADSSTFRSLQQLYVPVAKERLNRRSLPDLVRLYVGVDENLVVAAYAHSNRADAEEQEFLSGVPLAIRVKEV